MHVHVEARGQFSVLLSHFALYFLRQFLTELRFRDLARLACCDPWRSLYAPSSTGMIHVELSTTGFFVGPRGQAQDLVFGDEHITSSAVT